MYADSKVRLALVFITLASAAAACPAQVAPSSNPPGPPSAVHTPPASAMPSLAGAGLSGLTIGALANLQRDALEAEAAKRATAAVTLMAPPPPSIPVKPIAQEVPPPPLREAQLIAVVASGKQTFAEWEDSAVVRRVNVGDDVVGWKVTAIDPSGVRVSRATEQRLVAVGTRLQERREKLAK